MTSLLFRGGLLLDPISHTSTEPIAVRRADLQVTDGLIAATGTDLPAPPGAEEIDASDAFVLPGFVDTHRHTWQLALRAAAADGSFGDYLTRVLGTLSLRFRPIDVYRASLVGALEALNSGITTLTDWSHLQFSPEHSDAAVEAFRRSGARVLFGYGSPDLPGGNGLPLPDDVRRIHASLADDELVTLAVAARGPAFGGEDAARQEWALADELDVAIHVHLNGDEALRQLHQLGMLRSGTVYAHANGVEESGLKLIADSGGAISVAPFIEAKMGFGFPMTRPALAAGVPTGLAIDAVASSAGDMFTQLRSAYELEHVRPEGRPLTTDDTLRVATAGGAAAIGRADQLGTLRTGATADLVLLRTDTVPMAALHDPVAGVVYQADTSAVDTVLVGGRVVKRDGRLVYHDLAKLLDELRDSAAYLGS